MMSGKIPDWIIFYGDGSTFDSTQGEAGEAPSADVQVVVQIDADHKWVTYAQSKCYVWGWKDDNRWIGVDDLGYLDYLLNYRGWKAILVGRWCDEKTFNRIFKRATDWIAEKSSFSPEELHPT